MKKYLILALSVVMMVSVLVGCGAAGGNAESVPESGGAEEALSLVGDFTTTRYFSDEAVADADIERILAAGVNTASASNRQPWHFTAITSADTLQEVSNAVNARREANRQSPLPEPEPGKAVETNIARIPLLVVVSMDEGAELNAGLAAQNMAVMAQLLGYGTKIETSPASAINDNLDTLGTVLGIPEGKRAAAVIKIGKPDLSVDETLDGFTAATARNPMDEVTTRVS